MSNEKVARNERIRKWHKSHPKWSLARIGLRYGIKRQRVFQILQKGEEK
jgi:DNA-directed RNA polymerase sigma subunit (sigma70/sigma32)